MSATRAAAPVPRGPAGAHRADPDAAPPADRAAPSPSAASPADAGDPVPLADYRFDLPPELIAQTPVARRDAARLLCVDRRSGAWTHARVADLPAWLRPGDLLVVNDTRVIPARTRGRTAGGARVELLWVRPAGTGQWECLGRPGRRLRPGTIVAGPDGTAVEVAAAAGEGRYLVRVPPALDVPAWLERVGDIPLPPYIRRPGGPLPLDRDRYQTVFAAVPGSVAAPTAGLHFTPSLLAALEQRGVRRAALTLHVGPATFLPVRAADARRHVLDPEWCEIPEATAAAVAETRAGGGRVVAVGTTTTRALESAAAANGVQPGGRWADAFILPGYRFRVVDVLFTNFHLPGSTLLLLVSAFAGRTLLLQAYAEAIAQRYRFYSYGDAMLLL